MLAIIHIIIVVIAVVLELKANYITYYKNVNITVELPWLD